MKERILQGARLVKLWGEWAVGHVHAEFRCRQINWMAAKGQKSAAEAGFSLTDTQREFTRATDSVSSTLAAIDFKDTESVRQFNESRDLSLSGSAPVLLTRSELILEKSKQGKEHLENLRRDLWVLTKDFLKSL